MFTTGTRTARTASRSKSRSRSPKASGPTEGYSCTLYEDYLVFYGGKCGREIISEVGVYDLNSKKMQRNGANFGGDPRLPRFSHSSSLFYRNGENFVIFFGGQSEINSTRENYSTGGYNQNMALRLKATGAGLQRSPEHGLTGPNLPSPISNISQDMLYLYQPGKENGNLGALKVYNLLTQSDWVEFPGVQGDLKLSFPSDCAVFCDNNLYLFAENEDNSLRKRTGSEKIFEDVYVLDLTENDKKPRWRKVSPGGQAPGLLTNVSMTAANGVIYVFGVKLGELGGESKSGLWTYDTKGETWNEVKDIGTLTASPNQRAIIYKNQLLIVDWSYPNQSVDIQYHNLNSLSFVVPSAGNKQICRDQPDGFIQHSKNLYDGRLFADITFEVEGEEIPAHKAILAYRSSYFMKMFTSGMSESHSTKISIPNVKSHIFKALLQYVYCNEIELDEQLALDLIPVVDEYLMKGLKGLCEKYLSKQLRKDNVVDMLIVADRHEIEELKKACFGFILKNLGNIDENEEMMKLSKTLFIELLKFNTSGGPQSSSKKNDDNEEEEEKSNYYGGYGTAKASAKKATPMPSQGFGFSSFGAAPSYGFGAQAGSREKPRSPARATKK